MGRSARRGVADHQRPLDDRVDRPHFSEPRDRHAEQRRLFDQGDGISAANLCRDDRPEIGLVIRSHVPFEPCRHRCLIVVAGMDGALPGVVAGLTGVPVIAVPTSTGYGASFGGLAALLTMLTACAPGVLVVNIDNGFGAGVAAARIVRSLEQ